MNRDSFARVWRRAVVLLSILSVPMGMLPHDVAAQGGGANPSRLTGVAASVVAPQAVGVDLSLTKSHARSFGVGTVSTYTLVVANTGDATTTGPITITDDLPTGLTFASASGGGFSCAAIGQVVTCTRNGTLAPGEATSFALNVNVAAAALPSVTNTATVATPDESSALLGNNTSSDVTPVVPAGNNDPFIDLLLTKSHSGNFTVGQNGVYSIVVVNLGDRMTTGDLTLTDNLPNGLTYVSAVGTGWSCSAIGQQVTCSNPIRLAQSQSTTLQLTVAVGASAYPAVTNTATVSTPNETPGRRGNNTSNDPTRVDLPPALDLAIVKTATSAFAVGQSATYQLSVSNVSTVSTTGTTTISDPLPAGLTFVSATGAGWACGFAAGTVSCSTPGPLAPGTTSNVVVTVQVASAAAPAVTNTATVQSPGDGNPSNDTSTITTPVSLLDVAIAKSHSGSFTVGQNGVYTLAVTNVGNTTTTGPLTVTDNLPAGLSFVSAAGTGWSCSANGLVVTCSNPSTFAPAASIPPITLTVSVAAAAVPSVTNVATVATPGDVVPGNNTASDVTPVSLLDVAIAKSHSGSFTIGQNGVYTLAVTNVGSLTTTGPLSVTDNLPAGLSFVSAIGTGWSCSANAAVVSCTNPSTFAPGASIPPITLTVSVAAAAAPSVTNVATVATPGDVVPGNNTASDLTPVGLSQSLDLAIVKSTTGSFTIGQSATYLLTVSNLSALPTTGTTTISDPLPAGLTFVSAAGNGWTCGFASGTVTCTTPGPISPGSSATVTVTVTVGGAAAPSVTNTATVQTPGDSDPTNNTSSVTSPVGDVLDVAITKTHTGNFTVGRNGVYTIGVRNAGSLPTTGGLTVTDNLPSGLSFVSASGTGWSCSALGSLVTCQNPAILPPGGVAPNITLTVAVAAAAAPSVTNVATVSTPGDAVPGNNTAEDPTAVAELPLDLAIVKSGPTQVTVGSNATFDLMVTNVSSFATTGTTTVTDVLEPGLTFVSAAGSGWSCGAVGQTVTCTKPAPILPGTASTIAITVAVGSASPAPSSNTGVVSTPGDGNPANDSSTITFSTTGVSPSIDLTIQKTTSTLVAGQRGTFTLAVTNNDDPTVKPTTVTDNLPTGLSYVSYSGAGFSCGAAGQLVSCLYAGNLSTKQTVSVTLTVDVAAALAGTQISNVGVVKNPDDKNPKNDTSTVSTTVVGVPDLSMVKRAARPVVSGQNVTYTLTIANNGPYATGSTTLPITVTDNLPAGFSFVSATGPGWSCNAAGQLVTCVSAGPLAVGASSVITLVTSPATLANTPATNTAVVKTPDDPNPDNDTGSDQIAIPIPQIDLETTKLASAAAFLVGQPASYTIRVVNKGELPTTQPITVTDQVHPSLSVVSASGTGWSCGVSAQTVTCTYAGVLGSGAIAQVTINVVPLAAAVPAVQNTAFSQSPEDFQPANDTSTVNTPVSGTVDLSLTKEAVGSFQVGQQGRFTLTVRHTGSIPAAGPITVSDTLPAGLSFVSATGSGWSCSASGNIITCTRASPFAVGETSTIDLRVSVAAAAIPQVTNCATVSAASDTSPLNNQGCVNVTVAGRPALTITKTVSKADAQIGDVLDYTVVVTNTGTANLPNAVVTDTLPIGFAYESRTARVGRRTIADPAGAPGPRLAFAIGAVNIGTPVTLSYRVRITAAAKLGNNTNVAVAASSDGGTLSGPARATTRITGGVFDERGAIVGKVYTQCNCASAMQEAGEVGIPGVRIYLEDGSSVVTDVEGKYNFYNVANRLHTVKVDRTTLPAGAVLVPLSNRNALDGYSRFADVKGGEMHKADFAEGSGSAEVLRLVLERRRAGEVENAGTQIKDAALPPAIATAGTPAARSANGTPLPAATPADSIPIAYTTTVPGVVQPSDSSSMPVHQAEGYQPLVGTARTLTDANSQLPMTPLRALDAQQGRNPFGYGRVQLEVPQQGIPADGQTLVKIVVRAVDGSGNPLTGRIPVTLEASLGRWLGDEINATEQGRQVMLEGGEGSYTLIAAAQPGRGEVRVTTPDGVATMPIAFIPAVRPLMASGLLNARIDFRSLIRGGNALASDADGFEEAMRDWTFENDSGKVRGGARGALLLKGKVGEDALLTLSYDSERDRGATLFRDIRPDAFFPVYGDGSLREFDAQSRRNFYARLDRGTSYTMFGDFQTSRADERRILGAYDRTLNGALQHFEGKNGTATLFASQGRIRQAVDEIPGRGISGPYTLTNASGLINSERVEILTRDRNQPSVILTRVVLTRFADYTIEPLTGRLLFRVPVPSADANLNPVSIRVTYETEDANSKNFWVYGGDASVRVGRALEIGGTYAQDENPLLKSRLAGVNATAKLGRASFLFGEYAQTDVGGTTGDAFRIELRHQSERVEGRVFAARSDSAFTNTSSTFFGGRTEFGGRFSTRLDDKTRLIGDALHTENNTAFDGKRDGALIAIERTFDKAWRGEFGYRYAKESGNYSPYPGAGLTQINRGLVDNDVSALRGRLTWTLPEQTRSSIFTEYEQDIRDDSHRGAIGGEYIISNRTRLYARHEWLSSTQGPYATNQGTDQQYTVFGVDADYLKNTQMFSEYRGRDSFNGRDAEASIGLRNRWAVAPGLLVNTSFERVSPLVGVGLGTAQSAGTGDALAVTGGVEWTKPSLWKSTARLEYRDADTGDNFLASLGYARKLTRDWTFLGRTLWDVFDPNQKQTRGWSQLGFAWRETDRNQWNAVMRYENRLTRLGSNGVTPSTENNANILAALVNYQPQNRVTLSGRYAAKFASDDIGALSTKTNSQLLMGRGIFDLNRRLDAGVISSVLFSDGFSSRRYGLGAELGLIVMKNLRVAGGYNVFGFTDKDLNSFGTTRKGLYLDLGFKFDESLFGLGGAGAAPCDNACSAGGKEE